MRDFLTDVLVVEKTNSGIREISLLAKQLQQRKIFLNGLIDTATANRFLLQMMYLQKEPDKEINIYVNSEGGDVNAGLMIYDLISMAEMPINISCTGKAASVAALIVAGGKKGRRFIFPHSEVSLYEPVLRFEPGIRTDFESKQKLQVTLCKILLKHTGKRREEINKALENNCYISAEESIKFGICDEIRCLY